MHNIIEYVRWGCMIYISGQSSRRRAARTMRPWALCNYCVNDKPSLCALYTTERFVWAIKEPAWMKTWCSAVGTKNSEEERDKSGEAVCVRGMIERFGCGFMASLFTGLFVNSLQPVETVWGNFMCMCLRASHSQKSETDSTFAACICIYVCQI